MQPNHGGPGLIEPMRLEPRATRLQRSAEFELTLQPFSLPLCVESSFALPTSKAVSATSMSRPPSRLSEGSSTRGKRPPSRESADAFVNSASFAIKKEPSPKPVGKPSVTAADEAREGWSGAEIVTQKLRRPPADEKLIEDKELAWVGLESYVEENIKEQSHEELRAVDARRKSLLELARNTSASSTLFKLWQLPRTVLPRLVKKPLIWLVLLTFVCGAIVSRFELLSEENVAEAAALDTERGATTVTFMVVFYVGYVSLLPSPCSPALAAQPPYIFMSPTSIHAVCVLLAPPRSATRAATSNSTTCSS